MAEHNETTAHQIASRAAIQLVKEGVAAGLSWSDILISCETAIAIVALASAEMSGASDKARWASEMMDTMTEHAQLRVSAQLNGVSYEG